MKYPGKLGKPRAYRDLPGGLLATDEQKRAWIQKEGEESAAAMKLLCQHYGHEYGDWMQLA